MDASTRRVIRTAFQITLAVASILLVATPAVLSAAEAALTPEQAAVVAAAGATIVGVASLVARVMQSPIVAELIDRFAPWLSADEPADREIEG
ncbi:hypothetical protein ACIA8K_12580 [Catenuloplanes sp. NPDC051500]|uniref:hypothetical protein n=1 Tax=Catenuloplanes sp. NPDC051500 TaxID=3363959 RepID=UPI003796E08E